MSAREVEILQKYVSCSDDFDGNDLDDLLGHDIWGWDDGDVAQHFDVLKQVIDKLVVEGYGGLLFVSEFPMLMRYTLGVAAAKNVDVLAAMEKWADDGKHVTAALTCMLEHGLKLPVKMVDVHFDDQVLVDHGYKGREQQIRAQLSLTS